ncbi:MAG: rhomboid family intramembrane serine protease [Lachnospiraceae bacterium]|nr:rhomboid family intramembrane serine protease [Lachnospiraceae bacterium]
MSWIDKLERRFGRYAVNNLMLYLIICYAVGYLIYITNPSFYYNWLCLDASAILHGQIWRIVTYLVAPPSYNLIWLVLLSVIYYSLGRSLEQLWGTFRFNLYIIIGVLANVLAALIIYLVWGQIYILDAGNLYMTMLLAFAATMPDMQFYLYFVIPIKAKWLGIFYAAYIALEFFASNGPGRVSIVMSLLNFLLFFFEARKPVDSVHQAKRRRDYTKKMRAGAGRPGAPRHRCAVCGRTEQDDPNLEFRFCSKCAGNYEYCQDHLYTHVHVTQDSRSGNR